MGVATKHSSMDDRFKKIQEHCDKNDVEISINYDPIERLWDVWVDNEDQDPDTSVETMEEVVEYLESEFELD